MVPNDTIQDEHSPVTRSPLTPREMTMLDDLRWAMSAPEVQQHHGQLVVVRNRKVLAVGTDRQALVSRAAAAEGCAGEDLVVVVVAPEGIWDVPH
jgi:hypothetical protein